MIHTFSLFLLQTVFRYTVEQRANGKLFFHTHYFHASSFQYM